MRGGRVENHNGKTTLPSVHPTKIRTSDLPVIGRLVYCEISALDHSSTEVGSGHGDLTNKYSSSDTLPSLLSGHDPLSEFLATAPEVLGSILSVSRCFCEAVGLERAQTQPPSYYLFRSDAVILTSPHSSRDAEPGFAGMLAALRAVRRPARWCVRGLREPMSALSGKPSGIDAGSCLDLGQTPPNSGTVGPGLYITPRESQIVDVCVCRIPFLAICSQHATGCIDSPGPRSRALGPVSHKPHVTVQCGYGGREGESCPWLAATPRAAWNSRSELVLISPEKLAGTFSYSHRLIEELLHGQNGLAIHCAKGALALSSASLKPILWDDGREGERRGVASQPTRVSFRSNKNRWITETVDGASYRTDLSDLHQTKFPELLSYSSPMASLVLTDSSQLTSDNQQLDLRVHVIAGCDQYRTGARARAGTRVYTTGFSVERDLIREETGACGHKW
uniref:Uncharacterized protein n=1 Tax=Timema bartmani TaxID=61472 RepID=A0A7R9ESM4_9NEOP|nr:unnamed protein product [Timema bartmani]